MEPYWDLVKEIIRESDIVLEIVDARLVDLSRNKQLEQIIKEMNRTRIIVVNKIDLVPRTDLELIREKLEKETKSHVVFVSNRSRKTIKILLARIRQVFAKQGKRQEFDEKTTPLIKRPFREAKGDIIVGVVGYPNVGKSSIINSLCFKKKMQVSKKAGTTHGVHWLKASDDIRLIDTPGVIPLAYEEESKLGIIAAKNAEKMKEPEVVAARVISLFLERGLITRFFRFYNVNPGQEILESKNPYEIIDYLGLEKKHLKKGGVVDDKRMGIIIVKDWQEGKLKL